MRSLVVWARSTKTNGRVVGAAAGSLAFPVQVLQLQEEAGGQSSTTNPDNRLVEMKKWTTPLAFGLDSRFSSGKKDTG